MRLLTGLVFSLGIMLVVVGGAELFTGNNLVVMAWASGRVNTRDLVLNWSVAFVGNFIGAFMTAGLMFHSTQYTFGEGAVGLAALTTANTKASLAFLPAVILGIMCNALVCLAVWMCYGARTTMDRVVTVVPPITAFVAAGFEHSIANIYFIPMGLFIKAGAPEAFWASVGKSVSDFPALTWTNFLHRQSPAGHHWQRHRRLLHGRRCLLVRLSPQEGSLSLRYRVLDGRAEALEDRSP